MISADLCSLFEMNVVQVSFDRYLEDMPRVLDALFQEEQSQQLDQVSPALTVLHHIVFSITFMAYDSHIKGI